MPQKIFIRAPKEKKNFPKPAKNCQKKRRGQTENRRNA